MTATDTATDIQAHPLLAQLVARHGRWVDADTIADWRTNQQGDNVLLFAGFTGVPRSIGILQPLIFLMLVGGSRAAARFWLADQAQRMQPRGRLLAGGGCPGMGLAKG